MNFKKTSRQLRELFLLFPFHSGNMEERQGMFFSFSMFIFDKGLINIVFFCSLEELQVIYGQFTCLFNDIEEKPKKVYDFKVH